MAVLIICFVGVLVQGGESYSSWFHSDSLHVYSQPAGCDVDVPTVGRNTQVRRNYTTPHKTQMIDTTINLLVNRTECTNLSSTTLNVEVGCEE